MSAKYTFLAWDTPIENASLKLALLQLANNANDNGFSFYSISKMAISCGMSEKTFQRKIQEMEKRGILIVERRANRPSLYNLIGDEMGVTLCSLENSEATESLSMATESRLVSDRESPVPNSLPKTTPESIIYNEIENEFNYFWSNGLNNGSKKKALESFTKIVKKSKKCPKEFSKELVDDCVARKNASQFGFDNLHATSYLNQERWTDEIKINQPTQARYANQPSQAIDMDDDSFMDVENFADKFGVNS